MKGVLGSLAKEKKRKSAEPGDKPDAEPAKRRKDEPLGKFP